MTDRTATNTWEGDLFSGTGITTLDSSGAVPALEVSWPRRTEEPGGYTSPEELIAAAHASCYNMELSNVLAKAGTRAERLETSATVSFSTEGGAHISGVALRVRGVVPGASEDGFREAANQAKDGCPVSKLIAGNTTIELDAALA